MDLQALVQRQHQKRATSGRNPIEQVGLSNSPVPRQPLVTPTMRDGFAGSGSASTSEEDDDVLTSCRREEMVNQHRISSPAF